MNVNSKRTVSIITIAVVLIYTGIITGWHLYTPRSNLAIQAPGADNRPEGTARSIHDVLIGERFVKYDDFESDLTGKWIQFRGEKSDNIIVTPETIRISGDDYPVLWTVETGEGYAAPVIYNGRAYFLDYIEAISSDALRCFSLETGNELWRRYYRSPMKRNHGFSRTVPAIGEGYIITVGPMGHVMCCDPITGDLKWTIDMQKEFGTKIPNWHAGQCPLVHDGIFVLAPAGEEILLAGFDCHTGEMIWSTPNTPRFVFSHSSVIPMTLGGKKMYVYVGEGGVCGVSAEEADRGTLLWETSGWRASVAVPSPVQVSNNRIFVCAGYNVGGAMLEINRQGAVWTASVIEQYAPLGGISSEQQTPIFHKNMLFTTMPKSATGTMRQRVALFSPSNLNTPLWTSPTNEVRSFNGPYIIINDYFFLFTEDGELFVYEILQQSMRLAKQQHIIDGKDAFGPLAYADGILILGDDSKMMALKITD